VERALMKNVLSVKGSREARGKMKGSWDGVAGVQGM